MTGKVQQLIELSEGRRNKMYYCTAGAPTVGIGHNLRDNVLSDRVIDAIFEDDLAQVERDLDRALPWWREHDEVRQAALIDLCFNMGIATLLTFKNTLSWFKARVYDAAASGLTQSKWYTQVGNRGPRIVEMVRTGQWPKELS